MPLTEQGFIYNWFASSGQNYYIFLLLLYLFLFLKCCSQIKTYLYIICKLYAKIYIWERPFLSSWIWIASLNIILSRLIHFPIKVYNYFFFTTEKNPSIVYMGYSSFILSTVGKYLCLFHFLALMNRTTINMDIQVSVW